MTPNSVVGMGMGSGDGEGGGGVVGEGGLKKGPWTASEDAILMDYVGKNGEGNWNAVQRNSGLNRCGKSCRLRWANHLRPNLKKGAFSPQEERLILQLHAKYGNKWARMAAQLPGRTDNEIKNYWNTRVKRRKRQGLPLYPHDIKPMAAQSQPTTPTSPLPATTPTTPTSTPTTPMAASSFFQFYNHSPTPSPTTMHSPLSSPHTFTPFPLIAPNSFTFHRPPPILAAPIRFKHFRANNNSIAAAPGFSHHPTLLVHSPAPQPHFSRVESFQFPMTLATDSSSPPHIVHTHSGMVMGNECLGSLKQELPPTQFHEFNDEKMGSGMSFGMGLLEDMLEEAQVLACNYVNNNSSSSSSCLVSPEEQRLFDGFHNLAQDSSNPDDCMFLTKEEDGGGDQAHGSSATEDWSNLLNMQHPQCYTHDKQDHNQLSYGQTTIDQYQYQYQHQHQHQHHHVNVGGLDVQHIAALFPVSAQSDKPTTTNNSSCPWDNLPRIC